MDECPLESKYRNAGITAICDPFRNIYNRQVLKKKMHCTFGWRNRIIYQIDVYMHLHCVNRLEWELFFLLISTATIRMSFCIQYSIKQSLENCKYENLLVLNNKLSGFECLRLNWFQTIIIIIRWKFRFDLNLIAV